MGSLINMIIVMLECLKRLKVLGEPGDSWIKSLLWEERSRRL